MAWAESSKVKVMVRLELQQYGVGSNSTSVFYLAAVFKNDAIQLSVALHVPYTNVMSR